MTVRMLRGDRFGVSRKTWFGIEDQVNTFLARSGFELPPLQYVDGSPLTVDRSTQTIERVAIFIV